MKTQTVKVFFACAVGSFIGALAALQLNHNSWWIGFSVGFSVGYLTYETKKLIIAVRQAWRMAWLELRAIGRLRWHPNKAWWRWYPKALLATCSFISLPAVPIFALGFREKGLTATLVGYPLASLLLGAWICPSLIYPTDPEKTQSSMADFFRLNCFRIYLWVVPKYLFKSFWLTVCWAPKLFSTAIALAMHFVKHVHTEIRLLCGIDAAFGAALGYGFHSVLVGAIAGGLIGVLNFEIVSIRLFRLVPKRQSLFRR